MDASAERLYDEYLDAAMAGRAVSPDEFLEGHPGTDPVLREALRAVYHEYANLPERPERPDIPSPPAASSGRDRLDDFRLIERLGEGGMGVVFLAEQVSLRRLVALKLLRPEAAMSRTATVRFEREALSAARLNHPNIASVIAAGEHRGTRYIAMEYVEGRGLDEILSEAASDGRSIAVPRCVRWCAQVARALDCAHSHGVIHRDVKPSNIRITPDDRAILLDFGVARDAAQAATLTESFIGSPYYAAPEQVSPRGSGVDARTDVYSAGVVLYECLTGQAPFEKGSFEQVLGAILTIEPATPRRLRRQIPRDVETAVMKAIEKDPAARYQDAGALARDLEAILDLRPIESRPPGFVSRMVRWSRRRRPLAAAITTAAAAVVVASAAVAWRSIEHSRDEQQRRDALVDQAESLLAGYAQARARIESNEREYERAISSGESRYTTPEEDALIEEAHRAVAYSRREREATFYHVLELANHAERSGVPRARVDRIRALAYMERTFDAEVAHSVEAPMYSELARLHDIDGSVVTALVSATRLTVACDRPDADVHLFRRVYESDLRAGGERRLISIPIRGWPEDVTVGGWAWRVVEPAGSLEAGDAVLSIRGHPIRGSVFVVDGPPDIPRGTRLVSIDGRAVSDMYWARTLDEPGETAAVDREFRFEIEPGQARLRHARALSELGVSVGDGITLASRGGFPVSVWSGGRVRETVSPPGLGVRVTAAPTLLGDRSRVASSEHDDRTIDPGQYLIVATAPGSAMLRAVVHVPRGASVHFELRLPDAGECPPGFIPVRLSTDKVVFVQEREVTIREYFEFLNDPETLARVDASPSRIFYPWNGEEALGQRGPDGRFLLPDRWQWDWPMLHVSWTDAVEFAAWRTRRAREAGQHWTFALPSLDEWIEASAASPIGMYVFGDRMSAKWAGSCFARPKPWPEPVMSFPVDESALGIYDLAGSASEWTRTLWQPHHPHYRHAGGSWATGEQSQFAVYGGNGMLPDRHAGFIGFRLVADTVEPTR